MNSVLFLGLLIGMQHALEADHVAAVSSIAARESSAKKIVRQGVAWGIGHTVALLGGAGAVLVLGLNFGGQLAGWLEFGVGVMLVGLGGHVLYRLRRERIHFHIHAHDDKRHFHAHSHADEKVRHELSGHEHDHSRRVPVRPLLVGVTHGMAGSAALLILTTATRSTVADGLIYIAVFGVGSIVGMGLLSAAIAVPFAYTAKYLNRANDVLQLVVGVVTIGLGSSIMLHQNLAVGL